MLKRSLFLISVLFLLSTASSTDHALYIGVIQLEEQNDSTGIISVKVFSDDLQTALQSTYGFEEIEATQELCVSQSEKLLAYFRDNLDITINGLLSELQLEDCELVNDVHLLHFKIKTPNSWENIEIKAPFFMEVFPTQTNMIQASYEEVKWYGKTTKQEPIFKIIL